MVRIGTVWDRTTEVLGGRSGMLAGIAGITLVLPMLVRDAVTATLLTSQPGATTTLVVGLVGLLTVALTIFGQLAITAAATDPATLRRDAFAIATRRFWPAIGVYAVLVLAAIVVFLPVLVALIAAGLDLTQLQAGGVPRIASPGLVAFAGLYVFVAFLAGIWVTARLFVLNPVIVNERLGLKAFARSFALTRGSTLRIIGFILLVAIVLLVGLAAVQAVTGIVFRLLLGDGRPGLVMFLSSIGGTLVTTVYTVVVATFAAQFYVAARGEDYGDVFG